MISALALILLGIVLALGSAWIYTRWGWYSLPAFIVPILAYAVTQDSLLGISNLALPLGLGLMMGLAYRHNRTWQFYIISTALFFSLVMTGSYVYLLNVEQVDILRQSREQVALMLDQSGVSPDRKESVLADFETWTATAREILPFSTFLYGLFFAVAGLGFYQYLLRRRRVERWDLDGGVEGFRLPDWAIFGLIGSLAVTLLVDREQFYIPYIAGFNLLLVTAALYAIQGIGVIRYLLAKRGLPRYLFPLGMAMILLLGVEMIVFSSVLFAGYGTLDFWTDFRKLNGTMNTDTNKE